MKQEETKKEVVEEKIETQENVTEDSSKQVKTPEEKEEKCGINFMELLNNPAIEQLMKSGKDMFKKEKTDPDICEISIKAPSAVVLKLFKVSE